MELWRKQAVFSQNMANLIQYIHSRGVHVTMGECYRTIEQAQIYAKEGLGILDSQHRKRLAVDLNLFNDAGKILSAKEDYEPFGTYWKALTQDNRWGGDWKRLDLGHFEMMG